VLRHSFASYNEPIIAGLLGHKAHSITSRYLRSADAALLAAADDDPARSGSGGTGYRVSICALMRRTRATMA
jgi:hypothetical protein